MSKKDYLNWEFDPYTTTGESDAGVFGENAGEDIKIAKVKRIDIAIYDPKTGDQRWLEIKTRHDNGTYKSREEIKEQVDVWVEKRIIRQDTGDEIKSWIDSLRWR